LIDNEKEDLEPQTPVKPKEKITPPGEDENEVLLSDKETSTDDE
jgi:hypothetical protein